MRCCLSLVGLVVVVGAGLVVRAEEPVPGATDPAVAVLADWDRRRAAAYAAGDAASLRRLYTRGSRAGRRDVAVLEEYADRGLRVVGLRTQVLAVEVLVRRPERLVLAVTDRLAGAVAVGERREVALPRGRPVQRTITLRRQEGTWLVARVTGPP